ncbi:MAG: ferrous iron transporter B [bacterium]|nr:ferrous iron transporter B [bacterium]MBU1917829.1 ferrous iron transporter B [bacterium]
MQKTVVLAGNPNVGKSTLFNLLTGSKQKIANYPGVTVDRHVGTYRTTHGEQIEITDLPGTYSLNTKSEDEVIAAKYIQGNVEGLKRPDVVVVMIEASKLRRGLLLVTQIQKIHDNIILVLNMMDELAVFGMEIDVSLLAKELNLPVVPMVAKSGQGLGLLKKEIDQRGIIIDEPLVRQQTGPWSEGVEEEYKHIDAIIARVVEERKRKKHDFSEKMDGVLLHPILGPIIFIAVIMFLFQALFTWSVPFMNVIEEAVSFVATQARAYIKPLWLASLLSDGIISGVGAVLVFVPQILIAFIFIGFLEMTGYLARGAFLIDRFMRLFGLEGRSFIPLISSFACAIPGILATRTIANPRQRLITILMTPFMTCSARLPVYTLLIACFIPANYVFGFLNLQALALFALFLAGILGAMVMASVMNRVLPKKEKGAFFLELPRYRVPSVKALYYYVWTRVFVFLKTAGTIIFICSVVIWFSASFPYPQETADHFTQLKTNIATSTQSDEIKKDQLALLGLEEAGKRLEESLMGRLGKFIEPAIRPLGFDWKIGIGLLASFAAREVFVSTMGIVYKLGPADEQSETLRDKLRGALKTDGTPVYTIRTALALLAFFAFAAQCMSTLAVMRRETNSYKWPIFVFLIMTIFAYSMAFMVYQGMGFMGFE